jgi:RND family efflux transporter MFP subunit
MKEATTWMERGIVHLVWLLLGAALAYLLMANPLELGWLGAGEAGRDTMASEDAAEQETLWTCSMDPHVVEHEPGNCPVCGMRLVPLQVGSASTVNLDPGVVQNMNVQTVEVALVDLNQEIRTVGYLEYDQERMVSVTTKYAGWVEKVYANYVGEPVTKGQALFEIYSPELVQTEQELLSALDYVRRLEGAPEEARRRAMALVEATRTRLSYWDISPDQIAQLEETGTTFRTLQVVAPASGVIMQRMKGLEGMAVQPGMEIFHIADLSSLWLSVEVFENQLAVIGVGTPAEVTFAYLPDEAFRGTVRYIEPEFSEQTRTLRVKLAVPNARGKLRSGMFATVVFRPRSASQVVAVPSLAVLRTGQRNMIVVDLGEGRFEPREVTLGHQVEGMVEVLEGIEVGERVVTSAQFLIDSEASIQEAIQKMMAQPEHAGH